jgi:gliding motility-associated protein GldM
MAIHKIKLSPRQKMINLMYVVLMAMLALNVSSDVLQGFSLVDQMLNRKVESASSGNKLLLADIQEAMNNNPEATKEWYDKAKQVQKASDELYDYLENLKIEIVKEADGEDSDIHNINSKENLEAGTYVMVAQKKGEQLYTKINEYRHMIQKMILDPQKRENVLKNLSTDIPGKTNTSAPKWASYHFEHIPVAADIVLLSKFQDDVRYAEEEALHGFLANTNINELDLRVNDVRAYVIPNSRTINQGEKYSAQVVVAAVDTTQNPEVYVNNTLLESGNGKFETIANTPGEHTFSGYVLLRKRDGSVIRRNFFQTYNVIAMKGEKPNEKPAEKPKEEPKKGGDDEEAKKAKAKAPAPKIGFATVSATLMNVLYAGFENPISISVGGASSVTATMTGGTFTDLGNGKYTAVPSTVGQDVTISVTASVGGHTEHIGDFPFRVRKLPDPTPYIQTGADDHFKGGRITKQALLAQSGIKAAIDDGLLNIPFSVTGFKMVMFDKMGNAVVEASNSASFTEAMKAQMRDMQRGKRFFITEVNAIGPDKIARTLPTAMPIIVR